MDFLGLIFPKDCLGCRKAGNYICDDCLRRQIKAFDVCPACGIVSFYGRVHARCRKRFGLNGLVSIWRYQGTVKAAITSLKYKFASDLASELALKAAIELKKRTLYLNKVVLVPIPLHPKRLMWRGFNQSEILGKLIAKDMGWEFYPKLLVRRIATLPQVGLDKEKRKANIKGVFAINCNHLVPDSYCLVLFDDVWTTGSTIKEAARLFKRVGMKEVWGLTMAR